jgi:membrane protease YdiL (CAAX protease family)
MRRVRRQWWRADVGFVPSGIDQLLLGVLIVVILAPFAEELMFRGLLLDWLKQKLTVWQANERSGVILESTR